MLAHRYIPDKYNVSGWYLSEKLDGTRCLWDGGLSRGIPTREVPWASILHPKTHFEKAKIKPVATGLWSRYGNPINAPSWFLNLLPPMMLDGELWAGHGNFQLCRSIVAQDNPDERWGDINFAVFSTPHPDNFAFDGVIKNPQMYCVINADKIGAFIRRRNEELGGQFLRVQDGATFEEELVCLRDALEGNQIYLHNQRKLPENPQKVIEEYLEKIIAAGGEGVVLRDPTSQWEPRRVRTLLKYKPLSDDEGTIVGFTAGKGKYLGMIGALILNYNGKRLELSGLTDEKRAFADKMMVEWAKNNPGEDTPYWVEGRHIKLKQVVTFKYRELSDDGIPKEARFSRNREEE